ncbi:DUF4236 domain-containing protein [Photobacterium toruni]|uniref:DUF4236 domain-containing protein n=1 Tax=Photobacterium toruni TaxID=1935446 RepID=UPI0009AF26D1|nr:DUF4236 domain-containing protein [Photobacterium toruni]
MIRYQKRIRFLPFLWFNVSKGGFSVTVGCRYIKLNVGRRGVWLSGSLVGTGLSVRKKLSMLKNKNE